MLQQTRVAAVLNHYERFLKRYPDVQTLARSRQASVLAAWSGLGYYRRARMMHQAAQQIVRDRSGQLPETAEQWRELPGIGRYTAAAIASIAYGEACAVVDGNVERVLQRLLRRRTLDPWQAANELLSRRRPGDFNQAMMELGATICTPRAPKCPACPVRQWCRSAKAEALPTTTKGAQPRQKVFLAYALARDGDRVLLTPRNEHETVMPGMWELPAAALARSSAESQFTLRHAIMNVDYRVLVITGPSRRRLTRIDADLMRKGQWFSPRRITGLPLTGLARKILKQAKII
ncbi:MAG: A/G-specific adenine glycosylase [Terriglobales bacterium]|jgi:A/G-specific adenine glycosylase